MAVILQSGSPDKIILSDDVSVASLSAEEEEAREEESTKEEE